MTSGEGWPLVASVTDPLMAAAAVGVKTALKVTLLPGAMVVDRGSPVTLNPAPAELTWEKMRVVLPLFVSMMGCELLVPVTTLPKLTIAGVAENTPALEFAGCPPPAAALV
jgi:hypothetical protein